MALLANRSCRPPSYVNRSVSGRKLLFFIFFQFTPSPLPPLSPPFDKEVFVLFRGYLGTLHLISSRGDEDETRIRRGVGVEVRCTYQLASVLFWAVCPPIRLFNRTPYYVRIRASQVP